MLVGLGLTLAGARDAAACGGDFVPPNEDDSPVTAHRMIMSVSPQQTTLWDEIEFTGKASSFAWVLPIKGKATVGLSADLMFSILDQLTETQVVTPPANCPPPPCTQRFNAPEGETEGAFAAADAGAAAHGVTVTEQQQVGPYETVQLHSTDPGALNAWLTGHGYAIPPAAAAVISQYVSAQFDFLAMKLAPGQGVTAMRPVRVTTPGAAAVLPLRMVAVGTGPSTSITLWVVADGRYEPQNFPFFTIGDSDIAWNWATGVSTYEMVRTSKEAALGGRGWQVESSLELAQYTIENDVVSGNIGFQGGFGGGLAESTTPAYLPVGDAGADSGESFDELDAGAVKDGGPETPDQARQLDLTTLFAGIQGPNARVTRLRSDMAHSAFTADLVLTASSDQSEISNVLNPANQIGEPNCPQYDQLCNIVGEVPRSQAGTLVYVDAGAADAGGSGGSDAAVLPGTQDQGGTITKGGCSTSANDTSMTSSVAGLLGFLGFAAVGARRRRRSGR
jgi:MYXO-CTERM domain-containing protein